MRDDAPAKIAQRAARQLKDSERIEGIVVIVVIINGELLRRIEYLIEPELKLVAPVTRFHDVLYLRALSSRPHQKLLRQVDRYRIKALRWNRGGTRRGRKDGIPWGGVPRERRVQRRLSGRGELASTGTGAAAAVLKNGRNGRII